MTNFEVECHDISDNMVERMNVDVDVFQVVLQVIMVVLLVINILYGVLKTYYRGNYAVSVIFLGFETFMHNFYFGELLTLKNVNERMKFEVPDWENAVLNILDISYIFVRILMAQHHGTSVFHIALRLGLEHFLGFDF